MSGKEALEKNALGDVLSSAVVAVSSVGENLSTLEKGEHY